MGATFNAHARRSREGYFEKYIHGQGADMGCGKDPVSHQAIQVDRIFGLDAQTPDLSAASLDYVFSSHCLEHLIDPHRAVDNWWALIRPGGHLICSVPDWILYEQRVFPSRFNADHKWSFTMFPIEMPHPNHLVLWELFKHLPDCQILSYRLCDDRFQYNDKTYDRTWAHSAEAEIEIICRKNPNTRWLASYP